MMQGLTVNKSGGTQIKLRKIPFCIVKIITEMNAVQGTTVFSSFNHEIKVLLADSRDRDGGARTVGRWRNGMNEPLGLGSRLQG